MKVKSLYIETTTRCNLNCRTCYNSSGKNRDCRELSAAQIAEIIQRFLSYGLQRVLISGGEPTLNSDFDGILALVDRFSMLNFGFVTNGTNHQARFIEVLNTRPNVTVQISLDGSCEEINARTRGAGHFDAAAEFARRVNTPAEKPLLKMVITQNNYEDVEAFYRLALSLGCMPEYAFVYRSGNGAQAWEDQSVSAKQKLAALRRIQSLNRETGTDAVLPRSTVSCPYVKGLDGLSLCIKPDGAIQPCQTLYGEQYTVGNVLNDPISELEKNLWEIHRIAKQRTCMDYGCGKCILNSHCGRGCMAMAANLNDDLLAADGDCEYRKLLLLGADLKEHISPR